MNHIHQQSRYSLFHLCGNKRDHQTQAGGNTDGDAETGSLSKPSDNRWSYQETKETDARNDGDDVVSAVYIERLYFLFVTYLIISRYRKTQT